MRIERMTLINGEKVSKMNVRQRLRLLANAVEDRDRIENLIKNAGQDNNETFKAHVARMQQKINDLVAVFDETPIESGYEDD